MRGDKCYEGRNHRDVYCGAPAILNRNGVKEIGEFHLLEDEAVQLGNSADTLRQAIGRLKRYC